jgi:hypothetical protein
MRYVVIVPAVGTAAPVAPLTRVTVTLAPIMGSVVPSRSTTPSTLP